MMIAWPPKWMIYTAVVATAIATIPPTIIWWMRTQTSPKPRIHFIQDMDNQARFKTQQPNDLFADGRADRPMVAGTVARGELREDDHYWTGWIDGGWADAFPDAVTIDRDFIERGRERYAIYCSMCHGLAGYGDGMVNRRAMELVENPEIGNGTQWVNPRNIHETEVRAQPVGQLYNVVTNGVRNMAGYAAQIPVEDRWAIVAWVKVLQRSQHAEPGDLGPGVDVNDLPLRDLRPEPADGAGDGEDDSATAAAPATDGQETAS